MSYVKTTIFSEIEKILDKRVFFPIFISGPTGCGKTFPIIELCKEKNRKIIPISVTHLTDENSLLGGLRIRDGSTFYEEGPVLTAMREGSVLLLDEFDLALPENILCLQTIIDGTGYFIKGKNEFLMHSPGFNIVATANTKGLGDESGTYIGTNILNEATLERFIINYEIDYMSETQELMVLQNFAKENNINVKEEWLKMLLTWANQIRETVKSSNDFAHNISTRRLVQIIKTFSIFEHEYISVSRCMNRFDKFHKESFMNMYDILDKGRIVTKTTETSKAFGKEFDKQFNKLNF